MDLTLHLHSWELPTTITVVWIVVTLLIGRAESREGGDFSVPVFTGFSLLGGAAASITAWGMWAAMHFGH